MKETSLGMTKLHSEYLLFPCDEVVPIKVYVNVYGDVPTSELLLLFTSDESSWCNSTH